MYRMEDETKCEYDSEDELKLANFTMYKICPKNTDLKLCYVGHTTNFNSRKNQHKTQTINTNLSKSHQKHYEAIRNNGGWDEWDMVEIEKFNGKTRLEARIREQELIEEHKANINTLKAFITEEERKTTKQAITEKYRIENKELLKEQTKKYKEEHKDVITEQMKKYREENKDKIYEKTKEYRENNKEKHQEWNKVWRENNKETSKEKRKIYEAKKKQEKLEQLALLEEPTKLTEEEKEQIKKEKRDKYNEKRRQQRLEEKQQNKSEN